MVERFVYIEDVGGSNPSVPTGQKKFEDAKRRKVLERSERSLVFSSPPVGDLVLT